MLSFVMLLLFICVLLFAKVAARGVLWKKVVVLRNFAKFSWKHLCEIPFLNKVASLRPATLFKKRLWHRCFHVNFAKFLRTPFLTEHFWWLLLYLRRRNFCKYVKIFSLVCSVFISCDIIRDKDVIRHEHTCLWRVNLMY